MSLEEKLAQLGSLWSFEILDHGRFDAEKAGRRLGEGIGQITRVAGATNLGSVAAAELANRIQRFLVEETRLGIPAIVHVEAMASRLGRELRAQGAQQTLAPILDITRDPRWGRLEETYGEDPYLVAELGAAYVRGIQGHGGPSDMVYATGKHMVGHGLPEGGLNHAPAHIGPRELNDEFLFPFEAAVCGAGLRSMMHAYDEIDGVPCVASRELFTTILRERWGFDGIVVSDYFGVDELITSHAVTDDLSEAAAMALEAGLDVELPTTRAFGAPLATALTSGRVSQAAVDAAVGRVLRAKFELGLFDDPYVDPAGAALPYESDRGDRAPVDRPAGQRRDAAAGGGSENRRGHRPERR